LLFIRLNYPVKKIVMVMSTDFVMGN